MPLLQSAVDKQLTHFDMVNLKDCRIELHVEIKSTEVLIASGHVDRDRDDLTGIGLRRILYVDLERCPLWICERYGNCNEYRQETYY
jgi:hypothetical protein